MKKKPTYEELEQKIKVLEQEVFERKHAEEALRKARNDLERRVKERTTEVSTVNKELKLEIEERKRAKEHIHHLTQQLMKAQENERRRLSRKLHDLAEQDLSALKKGGNPVFLALTLLDSRFRGNDGHPCDIVA